ncbi:uncharacterized protein LOC62_08G009851 [Vanrija pseudolonga]|uniref:Uncharacterized protein n=1 Tax=Vanrija pseudolonga TaxID=143232 RepID=A0AAF0YJD2_9TREE|nr:hypothetical protein LOC62_08G009851 [Vanrija pseudolonga]
MYDLAIHSWSDSDNLTVVSTNGTRIASFPLGFIRRGGDNSWRYVVDIVDLLIVRQGDQCTPLEDQYGVSVDLDSPPMAGTFIYRLPDDSVIFSRGPEYFSRFRPPNPAGSVSTRSDSKRSSVNQLFGLLHEEPPMFLTSCGLLLRDDLHHAFDRQVWSLYYKISDWSDGTTTNA